MGPSTPAVCTGTFQPGDVLAPAPRPPPASSFSSFHLSLRFSQGIYGCWLQGGLFLDAIKSSRSCFRSVPTWRLGIIHARWSSTCLWAWHRLLPDPTALARPSPCLVTPFRPGCPGSSTVSPQAPRSPLLAQAGGDACGTAGSA